jgi:hypothetical protein
VQRRGSKAASSEVGTCLRGRQALERGGDLSEGASRPRARRRLARGGVKPSSEAEILRRGARSSSETESRPRGTAADCLVVLTVYFGTPSMFITLWFVFWYTEVGPGRSAQAGRPSPLRWPVRSRFPCTRRILNPKSLGAAI